MKKSSKDGSTSYYENGMYKLIDVESIFQNSIHYGSIKKIINIIFLFNI